MSCKPRCDDKIIELRKNGLTYAAVAELLGIGSTTVADCMRRHGLSGKFRGQDDEYISKRPKKPKPIGPSPFSIIVQGDFDYINIRLLPTGKKQAKRLIVLLEKQGGDVIHEEGL